MRNDGHGGVPAEDRAVVDVGPPNPYGMRTEEGVVRWSGKEARKDPSQRQEAGDPAVVQQRRKEAGADDELPTHAQV
jgi:hypothetical protein